MGRLIDVAELETRVKGHLGEINLNHITLLDTIKLLCDELDEVDQHNTDLIEEMGKLIKRIETLESGKPTWMDKGE
jgi:FtsZ-binding cell division protein ZapB